MNWKLIITLSLFGLAMAFVTVYLVPQKAEAFAWLPVFLITAYMSVRRSPNRYFLNGFYVGIIDAVWVAAIHLIFYNDYLLHHPVIGTMNVKLKSDFIPLVAIIAITPFIGIFWGLIIGSFSFVVAKVLEIFKR